MADRFSHLADSTSSPSRSMFSVTPHDGNPLPTLPKALYVGQGGDIVLRCIDDGADVTFRNVPTGSIIRARASHVRATGTTAAYILAHC